MTEIESKLKQLRLKGMMQSWKSLEDTRRLHEISFREGMEMLLQAEEDERRNSRFERLLQNAHFRYQASLEEMNYDPSRGLDKNMITELASCQYINQGESILRKPCTIHASPRCSASYAANQ
jgi:DNA replication protein DnaC